MAHATERIGPTAHYTAYVWYRAGLPHAEHFVTREGAVLYWGFFALGEWLTRVSPAVPSMREYLEVRHRLIDAVVEERRPGCVVELGAGLTRRAVTWAADRGVPSVEVDLPHMVEAKRRGLARAPAELRARLRGRHTVTAVDVLGPRFGPRLAELIAGRPRPVVIAEGLLSYFDASERAGVLAAVARALREAGGGTLVCNLHTATEQARVGRAARVLRLAIRGLTGHRRALDPFADAAELRRAFARAGFDGVHEASPQAYVHRQPRLARLRSAGLVVVAEVGGTDGAGSLC